MRMKPSEMTNEELAIVLRGMKITGICPSQFEKECLMEVADRLEYLDIIVTNIKTLTKELETTNKLYIERVDRECI